MSEGRSWSNTSPCVETAGMSWWNSLFPGAGRKLPVIGRIDVILAYQLHRAEEHVSQCTFGKMITSWGLEHVYREASNVGRMWMKQALVEQGITDNKRTS